MTRNSLRFSLVLLAGAVLMPDPSAGVELVAHEALYRLTLLETSYQGAIVQSHGALGMRLKRQCKSWQSQSELLFTIEFDSGRKIRVHNMMRLREDAQRRRVEFAGWTNSNKSGKLDTSGRATIPASDDPGEVMLEKPKKDQRKLAIGMGLPTESLVKILDQLMAGETPAPVHYFDPYSKYTEMKLLGGPPTILTRPPEGDAELVEGKSWRLRVTPIFESAALNELGAHTVVQIHGSGVASYMIIDLGSMKLAANLVKVRKIESSGCAPAPAPVAPSPQISREDVPEEGISIEEIPTTAPREESPGEDAEPADS